MFQRQTRKSFPLGVIVLATAAVLAILFFIFKKNNPAAQPEPHLRPAEWLAIAKEYPHFVPDFAQKFKALEQVAAQSVQARGNKFGLDSEWTVEGPSNIGARINCIAVHPTNPQIIYVGFSQGGVWKTTDDGKTWQPIFDAQSVLTVGDITLDPKNPEVVYVGTGDLNIGGYFGVGKGLYKSTNGGQTWQHLGLENQSIISKVVVHPSNPNIIFVAAMGKPFQRDNERGLYRTLDGGQTWQQVLFIDPQVGITDLLMSPDNPNELFASSWNRIRTNKESLVAGENAGIWKTTDGGNNWTRLSDGLPSGVLGRIGLAQCKTQPNILYAEVVGSDSRLAAIYKSINRGASWEELPAIPGDGQDVLGGFGWYFSRIEVNPNNPNDIFVLGVDLWRSNDGGIFWFEASPPWWTYEVHADKHDLVFDSKGNILLATDGGLYRSADNCETWSDIENIPTTQLYRVGVSPFFSDFYFGGAQDNGTFGGNQNIAEWDRLYGGDGFQPAFHPTNSDIYYFETQNGGIVCTTNGGQFFESGTEGIEWDDRRHWDMQYFISSHNPDWMYTGTQRVYASKGHPPVWFPVSDDLTDGNIFGSRFHNISTLHESPLEQNLLFVGTTDGNVWRGNPSTSSWTQIQAGLPDRYVSSIKASPNFKDKVYVTFTGYRDGDNMGRIFRSDNRGDSWVSISGNLPNLAINDVYIYPGENDRIIFVGTDGGVYVTLDAGKKWQRLGSNFPVVPVYDLEINPVTRRLVAGSFGRSIQTFPLDSVLNATVSNFSPEDLAKIELQVLPNILANQSQIIVKNLPTSMPCEVVITNSDGKWVDRKTFQRGETPHWTLQKGNLTAGVYFVFAKIGGQNTTVQRLLVL